MQPFCFFSFSFFGFASYIMLCVHGQIDKDGLLIPRTSWWFSSYCVCSHNILEGVLGWPFGYSANYTIDEKMIPFLSSYAHSFTLMVLPKKIWNPFLPLIPFWRAVLALVLECYGIMDVRFYHSVGQVRHFVLSN
jgi:hypothetical protein